MQRPERRANQRLTRLSRRERQCLDILFQRGQATVAEVMQALPDPPSYSAVRATLNVLTEKGHAVHRQEGPRYVYQPAIPTDTARMAALTHVVTTFFGGSHEEAVVALLQQSDARLPRGTMERLTRQIQAARKDGR